MSASGWVPAFPKPVEIELWGGPRDGERRMVADPDQPLVLTYPPAELAAGPESGPKIVYRRRPVDLDEPEPWPLIFDYQKPVVV